MEQTTRVRSKGIKFKIIVQFLTPAFLQWLAEDLKNIESSFDITPNAAKSFNAEVLEELKLLKVDVKRSPMKRALKFFI